MATTIFSAVSTTGLSSIINATALNGTSQVVQTSGTTAATFAILIMQSDDQNTWIETGCVAGSEYYLFIPRHNYLRFNLVQITPSGTSTVTATLQAS